jgi:hypothetical protein
MTSQVEFWLRNRLPTCKLTVAPWVWFMVPAFLRIGGGDHRHLCQE